MIKLLRNISAVPRLEPAFLGHRRCLSCSSVVRDDGTKAKTNSNVKNVPIFPPNSSIVPEFVNNRNPRNLERLRIAEKATGWDLDKPERSFWNRLTVNVSGRHISAKIMHVYGAIPVSASTNEWCIKKFLYSTKDNVAAKTIGEVLARRCIQSGITEVACFMSEEERKKEKISLILNALQEGGVSLEEGDQIIIPWALNDSFYPEKSWEIYEDDPELDKLEQAAKVLNVMPKKAKSKKEN